MNFIFIIIYVFAFFKVSACKYPLTSAAIFQPDIKSSSLTGAYRPAEIEMTYNMTSQGGRCPQSSFAKYMVSIRKLEDQDNFGHTHFCGGVIIRPDLIITAAHCFKSNKKIIHSTSIRVVARTPDRLNKTPETQIVKVKKVIIPETLENIASFADIALLKLTENIKLDKNCGAVLSLPKQKINDSTLCVVLGWGKLYLHGPIANKILQLNVTLHSQKFCEVFMLDDGKGKICASDLNDFEKNPCSGDSGGPLICEGVLTGIVSYGFQCGFGIPTFYTDVYEYSNWIKENSGDTAKYSPEIFFSIMLVLLMFV